MSPDAAIRVDVPADAGADQLMVSAILVAPGDAVADGQLVAQLESDKALLDVNAPASGTVRSVRVAAGQSVGAGQTLLELVAKAAEVAAGQTRSAPVPAEEAPPKAPLDAAPATARPVQAPTEANPAVGTTVAGPAVRMYARRLGVDANDISPALGRILRRNDVEAFVRERIQSTRGATAGPELRPAMREGTQTADASRLRKATARQMSAALSVPHAWVSRELDITAIVRWRRGLAAEPDRGPPPSVTAWFVHALGLVLHRHPQFRWLYDPSNDAVLERRDVAVGVAVASTEGLVVITVPVPRHSTLTELGAAMAAGVDRARRSALLPADVAPACMTVSNLGTHGVDQITPLVRWPESSILGLGRARGDGDRTVIQATLGFDHRVLDGADAALLLDALARYAECGYEAWL